MPSLRSQAIHDFAADIRQSASNGPTAIKDLVGILIMAREQGGLFTGAEYAKLRALLDHPDRWPFRSQWGAETEWVGADVQLAVGHAIANLFLPLDKGSEEGAALYGPADKTAREMALWVYWTRALYAIADRLDEEAKRLDNDGQDFIERLLAGPDDVELTPRQLAQVAAELKRPLSLSAVQEEKRAGGQSETLTKRDKLTRILGFNRELQGAVDQAPVAEPAAHADNGDAQETSGGTARTTKPKRSTERGEGRTKLIAALTKYHEYYNGSCGKLEPIGNNELARLAGVAKRTASAFFSEKFHGHTKYRALCNDAPRLVAALKALNGEFQPHEFYDARTPDEVEQDDE
jgi:hypothetical protein